MRESSGRRGFKSSQEDKRGWFSASRVRAQAQGRAAIDHNDVPNQGRTQDGPFFEREGKRGGEFQPVTRRQAYLQDIVGWCRDVDKRRSHGATADPR